MTGTFVTVTSTVAKIFEPSVLDTIIVAEPVAIAVSKPFNTVTTPGLLEDHVIS